MTEAVASSMLAAGRAGARRPPRADALAGLPTEALLADGGDARLTLDPITGRNKYGCPPAPDEGLAEFASSTASIITPAAFRGRRASCATAWPPPGGP